MQTQDTAALKNILDYLPKRIKQAIEEYCKETELSPELVINQVVLEDD